MLPKSIKVNVAFWWIASVYLGWINWVLLDCLEGLAVDHKATIWLLAGLSSAAIISPIVFADGVFNGEGSRCSMVWALGLGVFAFTLYADVCLFHLLGIHIPGALELIFGNGLRHSIVTLEATGIEFKNLRTTLYSAVAIVGGVCVARMVVQRWVPLSFTVRRKVFAGAALLLSILVIGSEWLSPKTHASTRVWEEIHRVMPLTFAHRRRPNGEEVHLERLRAMLDASKMEQSVGLVDRPDVFVFVMESTRGDFVNADITPNLMSLKNDCIPPAGSLSNGNATHLAWFSLLTARQPFYLTEMRSRTNFWGTGPLRSLKANGYSVRVLAATDFSYYGMDEMVLGSGLGLANVFADCRFNEIGSLPRERRDGAIIERLRAQMTEGKEPKAFFVFLDGTHHDYYWPYDYVAPFRPFSASWDYTNFRLDRKELLGIINRYKNALSYDDSLIGGVLNALRASGRYDQSIILVVGDHGEEFLEHGKMVHANDLCREQTQIPFLLKPQKTATQIASLRRIPRLASHVDALPTILDLIGIPQEHSWDGESLLRKTSDWVITAGDNGARDPRTFCVSRSDVKLWFEMGDGAGVMSLQRSAYLTKVTDYWDRPVAMNLSQALNLYFDDVKKIVFSGD